ncbi:MAG: hypothetical protein HY722_05835, partial [Planctomycetes bacterium]|nr:hypothetical protein [Planctomycetota bacterium]
PGPSPRVRPQVPTRPAPQAPRNTRELEAVIEDAVLSGESVSIALPPPRPAAPRAEVEPPVRPPPPSAPAVPDRQRELLDRAQDLERRHGAAEVEASRLRGRVAELEARLRDEADTAERRAEASSAQAARRDGELRAERDEARLEADGLRARLDELARRRDEEEAKGGRLVQEAVGLQREVDSSRQRVEELADLRMEDARALDALKLDHAERERRLHDEVASLKAEVVRLGTEVEEGDARIFDLNVEAERLRQVEGLHQRVSEQMDATVGERVRERLREIRDIHAGQAEENERLRSEVAALEERLAALKKDKETLGVAARGLERRLSEVQSAHDEAVAGREKLLRAHNRKLGELQGELQALASERDELARRAFDLENRGREHLLRIGELDRRAEQSESQRLALEVMAATARPGAVEPEALRQKRAQLEASLSAKEDRIAASLERTAQLRSRREAIARELEATDGSVRDPAARATRRGELEAERDEVETGLTVEEPRLSSLRDDRERLAAALAALGAGEAAQDLQRELERVRQEGRARVAALEDEVAALESARDHALRERESAREDTARDYERRLARADGIARELRRQVEELAGGAAPQAAPAATGGPAPTPASGGPPAVLGRLAAALAEGLNSPVRAVDEAMRTVADGVGDLGILLDAYGALPLEGLPDRDRRRIEGLRRDLALEVMLDGLANAVETGRREAGRTREAVALLRGFLRLEKERRGRSDASELGRTVAAVASMAAGGRATLRTSFAEAAEAPLWPGVLGQALLELVLDALEGAGEGEEVWLTTTAGGNFVRLEVRGSWGGAAEVVPPPAVEEAARRHGGEVTVTASPGRGATVAIKLPRA